MNWFSQLFKGSYGAMAIPAQVGTHTTFDTLEAPVAPRRYALDSNFAIFGMLFSVWVLIDQSFFPQWMGIYPSIFTAPLAALVLIRPNSVKFLLGLLLVSLWSFWVKVPFEVNNVFIGGFFASLILCATCIFVYRNKQFPQSLRELERGCFPAMRVGVVAIFLFAVIHKTNSAFLDPKISCAIFHYKVLRRTLVFLPAITNEVRGTVVIWLTWMTELSIPVLLALGWMKFPSRKFVTFGIVLALGFHYVMSFNGYQNFSVMALAYYVPFLPTTFYRSISATAIRLRRRGLGGALRIVQFFSAFVIALFALELFLFGVIKIARPGAVLHGERFLRNEGWYLFNFIVAPVVSLGFVWYSWMRWGQPNVMAGKKLPLWTLVPLGLVVLSSMSPYLGLKTENSFAMFSNLLTEGGAWNSKVFPHKIQIFHFQDRMVTVHKINLTAGPLVPLVDGKMRIVEFEFRRDMALACKHIQRPIEVEYEVGGQTYHVADAHKVPELSTPNNFWAEKLMYFRLVPNSPFGICMH